MKEPLYRQVARALRAYRNCQKRDVETPWEDRWEDRWLDRLEDELKQHLPSGSGFDAGSSLDIVASKPERLVFKTSFHHMDDHGSYCGWTEHTVIVTPSLEFDYVLRVTGRDRWQIKDYIAEVFQDYLSREMDWKAIKITA